MEKLQKKSVTLSPGSVPYQKVPTSCKEELNVYTDRAELNVSSLRHSEFVSQTKFELNPKSRLKRN